MYQCAKGVSVWLCTDPLCITAHLCSNSYGLGLRVRKVARVKKINKRQAASRGERGDVKSLVRSRLLQDFYLSSYPS